MTHVCVCVCMWCVHVCVHVVCPCVSGTCAFLRTPVFCCLRRRCTQAPRPLAKGRGILHFHGLPQ